MLSIADDETGPVHRAVTLELSRIDAVEADALLVRSIGLVSPWTEPVLGDVLPDGAAQAAGLMKDDLVIKVDTQAVTDGQQLREIIRSAVDPRGQTRSQRWVVYRSGQTRDLTVTPVAENSKGVWTGRIGAYIGKPPEMTMVRKGFADGLLGAFDQTWQVSTLSLTMMAKMLTGEASLRNLSGPLTIADYAGRSAAIGLTSYLVFLALISVSLGVLNLLPLPVLDGGHLMYYLWEAVTGKSVTEVWLERFQRGGVAVLMGMMAIALFNDVARLLG